MWRYFSGVLFSNNDLTAFATKPTEKCVMYDFSLSTKPGTASSRRAKRLSLPCMLGVWAFVSTQSSLFSCWGAPDSGQVCSLKHERWALLRFRLKLLMVSAVAPYACLVKCPSYCSGLSVLPVPFHLDCSVEISLVGFVWKFMQKCLRSTS